MEMKPWRSRAEASSVGHGLQKYWYTSGLETCLTSTANLMLPCVAEESWLHNWI